MFNICEDALLQQESTTTKIDLCYDKDTHTVHNKNCSRHDTEQMVHINYDEFAELIDQGCILCACCRAISKKVIAEKNKKLLEKWDYKYIYGGNTSTYHRPECERVLLCKIIFGTNSLDYLLKFGKRPCKECRPETAEDLQHDDDENGDDSYISALPKNSNREVKSAVKRYINATNDRSKGLKKPHLTESEKKDIITLTDTKFAFYAGEGYENFHLRTCWKLKKIKRIKGFKTYAEAVKSGHTPCKLCRPTSQNDVRYSIPLDSHFKSGETLEDIRNLCDKAGYKNRREDKFFHIETPVGIWRMYADGKLIKLAHKNLVYSLGTNEYHAQPKIFLSKTDAFNYIKKHDSALKKQKNKSKTFPHYSKDR